MESKLSDVIGPALRVITGAHAGAHTQETNTFPFVEPVM